MCASPLKGEAQDRFQKKWSFVKRGEFFLKPFNILASATRVKKILFFLSHAAIKKSPRAAGPPDKTTAKVSKTREKNSFWLFFLISVVLYFGFFYLWSLGFYEIFENLAKIFFKCYN